MSSSASPRSRLSRRLLPAAPLALAAIPSAQAVIVYSGTVDLTTASDPSVGIFVDFINGTAATGSSNSSDSPLPSANLSLSINPYYPPLYTVYGRARNDYGAGAGLALDLSSMKVTPLGANVPINGSLTFSAFNGFGYFNNQEPNETAAWPFTDFTAYVGVSINSGSVPVYGWMLVTLNSNYTLTLHSFALDNSGAAILTGDTGATPVPEPATTAALTALLAGTATLWRRRSKQKTAA